MIKTILQGVGVLVGAATTAVLVLQVSQATQGQKITELDRRVTTCEETDRTLAGRVDAATQRLESVDTKVTLLLDFWKIDYEAGGNERRTRRRGN